MCNGVFHMAKNESRLLWNTMTYFAQQFNGQRWSSGGSEVLTKALKEICDIKPEEFAFRHITGWLHLLSFNFLQLSE